MMVQRREFITLLGGAAAWPIAARAQQADRVRRVGVLIGAGEAESQARYGPFRDGLAQLGWTEARNIRFDYRWTDNKPDRANAYARELIGLAPDVIFASPGPIAEVLQRLTRTVPIVFSTSTDPVVAGYVQSYARPGGNLTGFTQFEVSIDTKYLQLLKDVAPDVTRVGILRSEGIAQGRRDFATVEAAARSFGVIPVDLLHQIGTPADIERAINAFVREPNGSLIVPPNNFYREHRALIVALAERHHLPAVYYNRLFVDAGGLMSYGVDLSDVWRRAASYVDRILRGAKPADLPVQAPTKFEFVFNIKTAKSLGLTISHEFLLTADEVIE
jgi:putative tryptophan/tyrosine transport system substrate-binding protein